MARSADAAALRGLPAVDSILQDPGIASRIGPVPRAAVVAFVREAVASVRKELAGGKTPEGSDPRKRCLDLACALLDGHVLRAMQRVVNATGILLHTGLGRGVLSEGARRAIVEAAGASNVELDLASGERNFREAHAEELLRLLTGAPAATVVNNNAAATWLALNTLSEGKEVVVARGQLVEIGGAFRLPEVMERAHVRLREVGTTNKVRASDYERAIGKGTGLLLHVHTSNYRVQGFTEETGIAAIAKIAHRKRLPAMDDLGSGAPLDFAAHGLAQEPHIGESLRAGADVVCFSGDKLLGGPQAGILLGSRAWIGKIRDNPLYRVVRPGKLTLAALEATLRDWLREESRWETVPLLRMLRATPDDLLRRAEAVLERLRAYAPSLAARAEAVRMESQLGSGSMPTHHLPSAGLSIQAAGRAADRLASALRRGTPPVVPRIQKDRVLLDLRTVEPGDDATLAHALAATSGTA